MARKSQRGGRMSRDQETNEKEAGRHALALALAGVAAVAAAHAAEAYGLAVLADGIEDEANNRTRFLVVVRADASGAEGPGGRAS